MLKKILKSKKLDRGDSVVTAILVFPLLISMFLTIVDSSVYMGNRSQLNGIARDAARTAAIFGGDGNASKMTTLEAAYGQSRTAACSGLTGDLVKGAYNSGSTSAIECNVLKNIQSNPGLVNVEVKAIACDPQTTTSIGQSVTCDITWRHNGIPGSILSFMKSGEKDQKARGSSEAEVVMNASNLVNR